MDGEEGGGGGWEGGGMVKAWLEERNVVYSLTTNFDKETKLTQVHFKLGATHSYISFQKKVGTEPKHNGSTYCCIIRNLRST